MTKFVELLSALPSTEGQAIPTASKLLARNETIVAFHESGDTTITVFSSGFLIYKRGKHLTVWAIDRCKYLCFDDIKVQRKDFEEMEWFHPIDYICNQRVEKNIEVERAKHESYYSIEDIDILYSKGDAHPFIDDEEIDYSSKVEEALSVLTENQKMIFVPLVSYPEMTYQQLADKLGISKQTVGKQFLAACKKLNVDPKTRTRVR
ncbi:MAG: hypothetical protein MJ238_06765 [Bacilli bacterium]|nr:hypothetical protein [Bacilli bacterium]